MGRSRRLKFWSDQGLTAVHAPGGSTRLVYRGDWSIPRDLKKAGWVHIGCPDSSAGHVFDAIQGEAGASSKLFRVTTPDGIHHDYEHRLDGDERMNNSYAAISPDGQWMLSGEWERMERILVFPSPILNASVPAGGGALDQTGVLELDRPVRNVQGATFVSPTRILCSTNDQQTDLWPTPCQLLQIDLAAPIGGDTVRGTVTSLGGLPLTSWCWGTFEVEGLDFDHATGDLRVVIIPPSPCGSVIVTTYRYRQA